jgi:hypothetical protein
MKQNIKALAVLMIAGLQLANNNTANAQTNSSSPLKISGLCRNLLQL